MERAVRQIAYLVLALLVAAGTWLAAGGDERMRLFTGILFGSCALAIAWKLWASRGQAAPMTAEPPAAYADDGIVAADPPAPGPATPSGPWRVYGHDTFAREDYFVGEFETEAEAREVARKKLERLGQFQDESLRDEIWVEPPGSRYRQSLDD